MPKKKKEKYWDYGMPKGELGPFVWHVWIKGKKKPERIVAFDHQHITDQLEGQEMIKAVKQPEEQDVIPASSFRPKTCLPIG